MKYDYLNQLLGNDSEFEDLFKDFDFNLLESQDFKEDAVREEIVFPILKKLGYSASNKNKIIRSKNLKHPFCYFGTKKHSVNIIPDYTFEIDGENKWILDAKRPSENIFEGKNVSQAYSYAVHQEIRSDFFCLCNGKEFSIFDVKQTNPILKFHIKDLKKNWKELEKYLSPEFVKKPHLRNFNSDMGLYIMRFGIEENFFLPMCFPMEGIGFIAKLTDNSYTINCSYGTYVAEGITQEFAGTFDFNEQQYLELLEILPHPLKIKISDALKRQPFKYVEIPSEKFHFNMYAVLDSKIQNNDDESYLPFIVKYFEKQ
ncbi:restriction endonuclease [Flavobacterium sp. W1B]|uniref:restriction endonuclease n=1 Tax=Flavobacterium sp. W1B TaxID=3394146 RepID=UPI0039BC6534